MKKTSLFRSTVILILAFAFMPSCRNSATKSNPALSYYWNELEEYGTLYPTFMGEIDLPENGKGFSVENDESELWADCYYFRIKNEEEDWAASYLRNNSNGPVVLLDTTYTQNGLTHLNKVVVYCGGDPMFYEISCSYPTEKEGKYDKLYRECVSKFPSFSKALKIVK